MFYLPSLSHKPIRILLNKYAKIHLLISFIYKYVSSSKKIKQAYFHIFRLIFITFFEIRTLTKDNRIYYLSQYIKSQEKYSQFDYANRFPKEIPPRWKSSNFIRAKRVTILYQTL